MIFPGRRIVLVSPLRPEEALKTLEGAIESRKGWKDKMLKTGSGKFTGEVTALGFTIVRDIAYRNGFLPQVTGAITPASPASRIEVTMKINPATLGFMCVWMGFIIFNCLNMLRSMAAAPGGHADYTFFEIMGGMALFGILLSRAGFRPEAKKAETFLKETLQAERETRSDSRRAI